MTVWSEIGIVGRIQLLLSVTEGQRLSLPQIQRELRVRAGPSRLRAHSIPTQEEILQFANENGLDSLIKLSKYQLNKKYGSA